MWIISFLCSYRWKVRKRVEFLGMMTTSTLFWCCFWGSIKATNTYLNQVFVKMFGYFDMVPRLKTRLVQGYHRDFLIKDF